MVRPREMDEILRQIGWTDGFNIPAINDENRELENEVSSMLREKASLLASVVELDDLLSSIKSHTGELKAECAQNESLLTTQQSQLDSEESLIKLLQGEEARLKSAIQLERQDRRSIEERCARIEAQLRSSEAGTRGMENDATSGQRARQEWERYEARASQATKTLAEFHKQDEAKLKELELQRARLQQEAASRSKELYDAVGVVGALEQQLDASARQYREGLAERQSLVQRWEASAAGVRARELSSRHLMQETSELRSALQSKHEQLAEARDFEENEVRNNRELEARSRSLGQQVGRLRTALKSQQQLRAALHDEVGALQCQLAGCGSELSETRVRGTEAATLLRERETRCQQLAQACDTRRARLVSLSALHGGAGERATRLQSMLHEKERVLAGLRQQCDRLDLEAARALQESARLRQAEDAAAANVGAQQTALRQVAVQKDAVERELQRHRDMLLCLELSVQRQQLRVQRLTSEKSKQIEDPKLAEREKALQATLLDKRATWDLLTRELRNMETGERQVVKWCVTARSELQDARGVERSLLATVDGGGHRVVEAEARVDQERARLALLRARVASRQEDVTHARGDVLHLRTSALQTERVVKLQSGELGVETGALAAEIAGVEQENSELRAAIAQRKLRLQQLQNVYDITVKTMEQDDEAEMGTNLADSATEYITRQRIRVAQEKGELVQRGNSLDSEIRRAEREIRAMEHTLAMVKSANDRYRTNLALPGAAAEAADPALQSLVEAEEQRQKELRAELRQIRETEAHMLETCNKLRTAIAAADEQYRSLAASCVEREHEVAEVQREICEQEVKLKRASTQARRISRELRSGNPAQPTFEERDLEVREMKRVTSCALRELWSLGEEHVEARPLVSRYLQEKGLPPLAQSPAPSQRAPSGPPRTTSSRQSNVGAEQATSASPALLNIHFPEVPSPTGSQGSQHSKRTF